MSRVYRNRLRNKQDGIQLRIHGHGRVDGDVTAQSLDIEAGAHLVGYSRTRVEQEVEALQLAPGASAADAQQGTDFR